MWYTCEQCGDKYYSAATRLPFKVCQHCAMRTTVSEALTSLGWLALRGLCILGGIIVAGVIVKLCFGRP